MVNIQCSKYETKVYEKFFLSKTPKCINNNICTLETKPFWFSLGILWTYETILFVVAVSSANNISL